ncbi:MAG: hypothetical protein L6V79_02820 [Clostridium sp.]|nr:MAG: hypothetical protein L6V79_02820 [Clostridium sp.]
MESIQASGKRKNAGAFFYTNYGTNYGTLFFMKRCAKKCKNFTIKQGKKPPKTGGFYLWRSAGIFVHTRFVFLEADFFSLLCCPFYFFNTVGQSLF